MNGRDIHDARVTLGHKWGLGRALNKAEMGRALGLGGADPGQSIRDYERGTTAISGPIRELVRQFLSGVIPTGGLESIKAPKRDRPVQP